jgi:hypothetical protein
VSRSAPRRPRTGVFAGPSPPRGAWWPNTSLTPRIRGGAGWRWVHITETSSSLPLVVPRAQGACAACGGRTVPRAPQVLAHPGEEWGLLIVFEDPPVDIMGVGTCTPTVSVVSDLALEFGMFLL